MDASSARNSGEMNLELLGLCEKFSRMPKLHLHCFFPLASNMSCVDVFVSLVSSCDYVKMHTPTQQNECFLWFTIFCTKNDANCPRSIGSPFSASILICIENKD